MKCDVTIVLLLFGLSSITKVYSAQNCCKSGTIQRAEYYTAKDSCSGTNGTKILPECDGSRTILPANSWYRTKCTILNDSKNGELLDCRTQQFIVRSPNFCVGKVQGWQDAEVYCATRIERYSDLNFTVPNDEETFLTYFQLLDLVLNFLSFSLLAVTFYVYYLLIPTRQIEDDCLLNVAGCLTLAHFAFFYNIVDSDGVLLDLCITKLYFMYYFLLCGFCWFTLFMYYLWKKYKKEESAEQQTILRQFRIIGYGAPALLMLCINIHAHALKLSAQIGWEFDCESHQILIEDVYIFGPMIFCAGSNIYFWKNLEMHSETIPIKTTGEDSDKKRINSMLILNRRLSLALALPWLVFIILNGTTEIVESLTVEFIGFFADMATSCAGGIVALILVMSRAHVWKCVTHTYDYEWLHKWQPSDPEAISTLSDNSNFNVSQTLP